MSQTSHIPISNQYGILESPDVSTRLTMQFESALEENYSLFALMLTRGSLAINEGINRRDHSSITLRSNDHAKLH